MDTIGDVRASSCPLPFSHSLYPPTSYGECPVAPSCFLPVFLLHKWAGACIFLLSSSYTRDSMSWLPLLFRSCVYLALCSGTSFLAGHEKLLCFHNCLVFHCAVSQLWGVSFSLKQRWLAEAVCARHPLTVGPIPGLTGSEGGVLRTTVSCARGTCAPKAFPAD